MLQHDMSRHVFTLLPTAFGQELAKKKKKKKKLQLKAANQVANSGYRTEKEGLVVWLRWLEIFIVMNTNYYAEID